MRRSRQLLPALVAVACLLGGCTGAVILAANVPAAFGPYSRIPDVAYGDQPRQTLDVYVPDVPVMSPPAVIIFIHGGGWDSGDKDWYRFVGSGLAEKGFVAVLPNYRLTPDVGFPVFVEDAARAIAWTLRNAGNYGGDPQRVFIMGHSAGAHIAMLLALDARYLAAAGVSTDGIRGAVGLSGPYEFAIDSDLLRAVFGSAGDPRATQPIEFARADAPPLLLIHGTDDRICLDRNSIALAGRVRKAGGQADLRLYPGVSHGETVGGFSRLGRARAPTLEDVAAFVAAH